MKCPNCSFFNEVRAEFCKICGTKLDKKIDKVTNTVSLDEALREKYMPSSVDENLELPANPENSELPANLENAGIENDGTPAWELIPGLVVASSPRTHKKERAEDSVISDTSAENASAEDVSVEKEPVEEPAAEAPAVKEVPAEEVTEKVTEEVTEEDTSDAGKTVEESEETHSTLSEPPAEEVSDPKQSTDKLAYIPPVYESMTGFERIDDEAPPIVIPPVVEYDLRPEDETKNEKKDDDEYKDTLIKSSKDRWIIAIIVFLCILLIVLGAIIVRILWQWWNQDQLLTTTPRTTRTTSAASASTTTTVTTTNPERANPVIGKFTYDLQSYLVSEKTDFMGYMLNPMDAKLKLTDLQSIGVTKTEVEDVRYRDGTLYLNTWVFNVVEEKVYKRLVKWEFNCTIGEYIDVKDFKHDFVLDEDEQKRVETSENIEKTTATTQSSSGQSETSSTTEATTTTPATTAPTTTTAAAQTTTFDDSYFVKSGSVSGGSATESDSLSKMRMGDHGYFQRLVFDFLGEKAPVYTASIDDGGYTLNLYLANMTGHSGQPEIASWSTMTSIEVFSDSADSLQVQMRFREPIMINTFTIDDPGRIVIDIRSDSNWDTPQ